MNHKEKNINAYDKKADNYDNTLDGKFTEKFKNLLLTTISAKEGDYILDVGCGNGTLLSKIALTKSIHGYGTDISPLMVKNAAALNPDFRFAVSSCENIPFDSGLMDIITVCAAYHHFPNVDAFGDEAKRLIKHNGSLYIAEIFLPSVIRHIANIFLPFSKDGDVKFYSSSEITSTFFGKGFRLVNVMINRHIQIIHLQKIR